MSTSQRCFRWCFHYVKPEQSTTARQSQLTIKETMLTSLKLSTRKNETLSLVMNLTKQSVLNHFLLMEPSLIFWEKQSSVTRKSCSWTGKASILLSGPKKNPTLGCLLLFGAANSPLSDRSTNQHLIYMGPSLKLGTRFDFVAGSKLYNAFIRCKSTISWIQGPLNVI